MAAVTFMPSRVVPFVAERLSPMIACLSIVRNSPTFGSVDRQTGTQFDPIGDILFAIRSWAVSLILG
jgi:hypothetical protein